MALACGDDVTSGSTGRAYGGPLENPAWRHGQAVASVLKPPKPGRKVMAGMAVVVNRGKEPAVIEQIALVRPSGNVRLHGIFTADWRRDFWAADEYTWPPPRGDYDPGSIGRARGRVVPPVGATGHELGLEILVVLDLPRRGRYTFRAVRVDYRVGGRRYWVEAPYSYAICTPRTMKCADSPPYRSPHGG